MYDEQQYQVIRRQVIWRFVLRLTFIFNLLFFLLIMFQLAQDVGKTPDNILGSAFFVLIWGSGLLVHAALAFNVFGRLIDRATRRELEHEHRAEKPKHHSLELSDDGELVEIMDDEPPVEAIKRIESV